MRMREISQRRRNLAVCLRACFRRSERLPCLRISSISLCPVSAYAHVGCPVPCLVRVYPAYATTTQKFCFRYDMQRGKAPFRASASGFARGRDLCMNADPFCVSDFTRMLCSAWSSFLNAHPHPSAEMSISTESQVVSDIGFSESR
ncbi:hypothetical protein BDW22DRAFT_1043645 [Trametopsis cervina]|nr:hypothetical protein BDW22DRAFT_1043645 [Trametopsis cervina]